MLNTAKRLAGKEVTVKFIPLPYLGTGITVPVEKTGTLKPVRTMNGRNYIALVSEGKVILEKDVMDVQSIEEKASEAPVRK